MEGAKKALQAAAIAATGIQTFDVESIQANAAGKAFRDAEDRIKLCFDRYEVLFFLPIRLTLINATTIQAFFMG